jgi:hypothetical protein
MTSKKGEWKEDFTGCFDVIKGVFWNQRSEILKGEFDYIDPKDVQLFNVIGDGGQAYVYRACLKKHEVAVKMFKKNEGKWLQNIKFGVNLHASIF